MEVHEPHYGVTGGTPAAPGAGSVSVSGTLQSWSEQVQVGTECVLWWEGNCQDWGPVYETVYYSDGGTVTVTVNGAAKAVEYGSGSTATTIAAALRTAINGDALYPATAGGTGTTVTLTSKLAGAASNYALTTGVTWDTGHFGSASFTATRSGPTLTGGTDASGGTPGSCCSLDTPAVTLYTYDTLDNLTFVSQSGSRPRSFVYNSLAQLLSATNPESGTITYAYDSAGNVLTKTAPAPNQTNPAVTVTSTFAYDELNRLKKKTYSDGTTPTVRYSYDGVTFESCASALSTSLAVGRRTAMCDGAGTESLSYDGLDRVLTARRSIGAVTKDFSYQYYETGDLWKLTYPSGRTITYQVTAGGDTEWAKDVANNMNYATAATYSPGGGLTSVTIGQTATFAGIQLNRTHNPRGQPITINAWSTNGVVLDLTYCFNVNIDLQTGNCAATPVINNGNVSQIKNNITTGRTQNFTYDELNRIKKAYTASTTGQHCWGIEHGYDIWANLLSISQLTTHPAPCSSGTLSVQVNGQNQISNPSGYLYDAAGNLTQIPNPGGLSMTYEAENRTTTTAGVTYTYDGEGRRLKKSSGIIYWSGINNNSLVETDATGNNPVEYIFFGGRLIARRDPPGTLYFFFGDHLGTARIVTNATGGVVEDSDFYPFGGERVVTDNLNNQRKFTGKERDAESGIDFFFARYFGSSIGRFHSPDPANAGAIEEDPQSWNAYAYARNNPLLYVDPDGLRYQVCVRDDASASGVACYEMTDAEFESMKQSAGPGIAFRGSSNGGTIYKWDKDQGWVPIGSYTWLGFDEQWKQILTAAGDFAVSEIKQGVVTMVLGAIGVAATEVIAARGAASRATSLGRTGGAPSPTVKATQSSVGAAEVSGLVAKAAATVGNQSVVASTKRIALAAAEKFVGPGAILIRAGRGSNSEIIGAISADGQRVFRYTSIGKPTPYINLENKATGGNLHIHF